MLCSQHLTLELRHLHSQREGHDTSKTALHPLRDQRYHYLDIYLEENYLALLRTEIRSTSRHHEMEAERPPQAYVPSAMEIY